MKIVSKTANNDIATVYIAQTENGKYIEFVESIQPPIPRQDKWVLIISTLFGCPVGCKMCDAGGFYKGKLTKQELLWQIDHLVSQYYPDRKIPVQKFKIQFARMGEPAFNPAVVELLADLPTIYDAPGLLPSVSTVAPQGCEQFFEDLLALKTANYSGGSFQLQFSLHTTDQNFRDQLIPVKKWSFAEIAEYGERFYTSGDRKITLNFALGRDYKFDVNELARYFSPELFAIKITPINPTLRALENDLGSYIKSDIADDKNSIVENLKNRGFEVFFSVGELEENKIGSNCGQYIQHYLDSNRKITGSYEYGVESATETT